MPRQSDEQVELYKAAIREELVRDVRITSIELVKRLQAKGIMIRDRQYAAKLRDKILTERIKRIDRRTELELRNEYFDVMRETMRRMFDILTDPFEYSHNKIAAAKEIRETYVQMLGGKADLAMLRGDIVINNNFHLPEAKRAEVVEALERFGFLPHGTEHNAARAIPPSDGRSGDPAASVEGL